MNLQDEANIVVNGIPLTNTQSMIIRVALESLVDTLRVDGLGEDAHGKSMVKNYIDRINEIREISRNK